MQLAGSLFAEACGHAGNDINTFPDYPSEIRAPEGTLYGVSAFQVHFGSSGINTTGDVIDVLIAMNASSLKVNLPLVRKGGLIIVDTQGFDERNLQLAGYSSDPLYNGIGQELIIIRVDFLQQIKPILKQNGIDVKLARQVRNIFALGIAYWLFDRPVLPTHQWLERKFSKKPDLLRANKLTLDAGMLYAASEPSMPHQIAVSSCAFPGGRYRNISGNQAIALGLVVAAQKAKLPLFLGSYPITPATEILQYISGYARYGVKYLQAEDEIAGITSAIGAAYGGSLAVTTTSGPGLSLKTEAIGLAIMTELPLVIVDVQRAGPSTGLPTKPEQSDLLQAFYGRHGEAPLCVVAAEGPADCFAMTIEAARIALQYMTPVILLSDGYIGQSSEPWRVPDINSLPDIAPTIVVDPTSFAPYKRNPETLARMWTIPGVKGLEHRIGGLEKADITGNVSHDPVNHEKMVHLRKEKIERISNSIPLLEVEGSPTGELLILSWGSTSGAARTAYERLNREGYPVSFANLRYLNPFPKNLGEILSSFKQIFIPELNTGQLKNIVQSRFNIRVIGYGKVQGQLFKAEEIEERVKAVINLEKSAV
jgi:2-oxoglutarate ferredoxin oxidoreductase subunit alpha